MGLKWKNAPVYFVIAQIRFSPVVNIESFIPEIQELFRRNGFPDFQLSQRIMLHLNGQQNSASETAMPIQEKSFFFGNQSRTQVLLLDSNSFTLQTTTYSAFEDLSELFLRRFEEVSSLVSPSYTERVGIRYLDAVMPKDNESIDQYLIPEVQGLRTYSKEKLLQTFSESRIQHEDGIVLSRVVRLRGKVAFPLDLHPTASQMILNSRFAGFEGHYAIIDTDGYNEERENLDVERLRNKLAALHTHVDDAFHKTITKFAVQQWK